MSQTRLQVMERMADSLGLRRTGQVTTTGLTSGSTAFADTLSRFEGDDYWNESFIVTTAPTSLTGIERKVSDYVQATQTLSFYSSLLSTGGLAFTTAVTYDIFRPPVEPYEYRTAIRAAASKLAARGITRRALDYTLQTTLSRRYATSTTIDVELTEVWMQAAELLPNNLWIEGTNGWTMDTSMSLTNDGPNGERVLKHSATGSGERSYQDIGVSPFEEIQLFASAKVETTGQSAAWSYAFLNSSGGQLGTGNFGSAVTSTSFTLQQGSAVAPANAAEVRIRFGATTNLSTAYTMAPNLMRYGAWERISGWKPEYDGETPYFLLPSQPPRGRRLKLLGRRTLESLSADTDTLSMDEPEIAAFVELACAEAWRQFGPRLGLDAGEVNQEILRHEQEYRRVVGSLGKEWRATRYARSPIFRSGH